MEIQPKLRIAIFEAANISAVTDLATSGVHYQVAPKGADCPFLTFDFLAGVPIYALANNRAGERFKVILSAYADEDSDTSKEPPQLCEEIIDAALTAISAGLEPEGFTCDYARKEQDLYFPPEELTDRYVFRRSVQLDIFAS